MTMNTIIMTMNDGSRKARCTPEALRPLEVFSKFKNCTRVEIIIPADGVEAKNDQTFVFDRCQFKV